MQETDSRSPRKRNISALVKARRYASMGMTLIENSPYKTEIDQLRKKGKTAWAIAKELSRRYPDADVPKESSIRSYFRKMNVGDIVKGTYTGKKELANEVNAHLREMIREITLCLQEVKRWRLRTRREEAKEKELGVNLPSRDAAIETYTKSVKELFNILRGFGLLHEHEDAKVEEETTIAAVDLKDEIATIVKMARHANIPFPTKSNGQATEPGQSN